MLSPVTGRGWLVTQMGKSCCVLSSGQEQQTGGRAEGVRGLIYMLRTLLPEVKSSKHLKFLHHTSHLTSGEVRVKRCELAFCNSYLRPQVNRAHFIELNLLLRTA